MFTANDVLNAADSWNLPEEWVMVVRVQKLDTGKVREKAFTKPKSARKFFEKNDKVGNWVIAYNAYEMTTNYCYTESD